ncbi:alpha/beta fold hydrolase [Streptomyces qaidamensis]|uniref:alpha/beta fold hydrolase n=1 Tax=Streptomyces qaidamensis TaxID=1783515 RepID=UPI0036518856
MTSAYEWRADFDNAALNALHADGFGHPLAGAAGSGSTVDLVSVTAPTLVPLGTEDPMFPPAHAEAIAAAVPGARLVMNDGMGHTLPRFLDDRLAAEILHHTSGAQA